MSVGDRIRAIRKGKGLTQMELAEALGVSQRAISELESGKTQAREQILAKVSEALECSFDDLSDSTEEPDPADVLVRLDSSAIPLIGTFNLGRFNWPAPYAIQETVEVPERMFRQDGFVIRAGDGSMEPEIQIYDDCLFDPNVTASHGSIVCCELHGEKATSCMVRWYMESDETISLQPTLLTDPRLHTICLVKKKSGGFRFQGEDYQVTIRGVLIGLLRNYS